MLKGIRLNEITSIGYLGSIDDLLVRCGHVPIEDVLFNRVVEKSGLLHDETHSFSQLLDIVLTSIDSIDQYGSEGRVIKAHD